MAGSPHYTKYPMRGSRLVFIGCFLGGLALYGFTPLSDPGGPTLRILLLVAAAILVVLAARTGTITSQDGITIRGFSWQVKTISWPDIQDIRIEKNPAAYPETPFTRGAPKLLVVIYDCRGNRVILPNVNQETLGKGNFLDAEVGHIRSAWEQLRGASWAPIPGMQRRGGGVVP